MTLETDVLKRIIRDGVGLNQATLTACLPEMISEIETLRARNQELTYALEATGDARFVK